MKKIALDNLRLLDFGGNIQIYGVMFASKSKVYLCPFPEESVADLDDLEQEVLCLSPADYERLLNQIDLLNVEIGPDKAIVRKSQRQIDQSISWRVYRRDGYRCRYCNREAPLTVDHVHLWEDGGASVEDNLLACCRRCNKIRGNTPYQDWIASDAYRAVSMSLSPFQRAKNVLLVDELSRLASIKVKWRSR